MLSMNQWDIEQAVAMHRNHPILSKATKLLQDLMYLANEVSDGWCYWPKPCRAAKKLQELIQANDVRSKKWDAPEVTEKDLKAAIAPIKAFMTREAKNLQGKTLDFPA
jgi:hypothetical protein